VAESLAAAVEGILGDADEVDETVSGTSVEYRRLGALFAVVELDGVEIHLRPDIAEAIVRTPDTAASARGEGWIRFSPTDLDPMAIDRLEAWLTAAWRGAAPSF
jgi:hypothetical protein